MIKKNRNYINKEYLYYLMNDLGLLNDYDLFEANVSFDEYDNPNEEILNKLEIYRDKKRRKD